MECIVHRALLCWQRKQGVEVVSRRGGKEAKVPKHPVQPTTYKLELELEDTRIGYTNSTGCTNERSIVRWN
jgi:hypothetical protein